MRKQIFSLLAAAMVFPIAAQMRSNSSSPDTSGTTPFVVRKAERIASSSPMRTLSAQKASPNTPTPYDVPFVEDFSSSSTLGDWYVQDVVGSRRMRPDVKLRPSRMRRLAGDASCQFGKGRCLHVVVLLQSAEGCKP